MTATTTLPARIVVPRGLYRPGYVFGAQLAEAPNYPAYQRVLASEPPGRWRAAFVKGFYDGVNGLVVRERGGTDGH